MAIRHFFVIVVFKIISALFQELIVHVLDAAAQLDAFSIRKKFIRDIYPLDGVFNSFSLNDMLISCDSHVVNIVRESSIAFYKEISHSVLILIITHLIISLINDLYNDAMYF